MPKIRTCCKQSEELKRLLKDRRTPTGMVLNDQGLWQLWVSQFLVSSSGRCFEQGKTPRVSSFLQRNLLPHNPKAPFCTRQSIPSTQFPERTIECTLGSSRSNQKCMQQERMLSLGSRKTGSLWGATQGYRKPRGFLRIASYLNGY